MNTRLVWLDPDRADDYRAVVTTELERVSSTGGPAEFAYIVYHLASWPDLRSDKTRVSPRYLRHQDDEHPTYLHLAEDWEDVTADIPIGPEDNPAAWLTVNIDLEQVPAEYGRWDQDTGGYVLPEDVDWPAVAIQALENLVEQINAGFAAIATEVDIRRVVTS